MKIEVKRKPIAILGGVLLLATLGAFAARPAPRSHLQILKGMDPVRYRIQNGPWHADSQYTAYSLQMPYDDAVNAVEKQLAPMGYKEVATYFTTTFTDPSGNETTTVMRARLDMFDPSFEKIPSTEYLMESLPDPHNWVVITESKNLNRVSGEWAFFELAMRHEEDRPCIFIYTNPAIGSTSQPVDTHKGSMDLEGSLNVFQYGF